MPTLFRLPALKNTLRNAVVGLTAASTGLVPVFPVTQAAAEQAVVNVSRAEQTIKLGLNKSKVIVLSADAHDILVANPAVADAVTRDARRIYIFGKQIGQTNVVVFDASGRQIAAINIEIERDMKGVTGGCKV